MPGLFGGFGNYFIPIYIGSSEIIYPRINNFSILILFLSYLLLLYLILGILYSLIFIFISRINYW